MSSSSPARPSLAFRAARLALAASVLALTSGCVENAMIEKYGPQDDWTPPAPAPVRTTPGAIFPGDPPSGSFLFFDRKARGVGDLVTVVINENTKAQSDATTDLQRKSSLKGGADSDVSLQNLVTKPIKSILKLGGLAQDTSIAAPGTNVNVLETDATTKFAGDGSTERTGKITAVVTCRVVEVLPGGLFRVRGRRSMIVNHEQQFLTVEGYLRQQDIAINNTVPSTALADSRLTFDGVGVVDDKQRPGIFARVVDWIYPF